MNAASRAAEARDRFGVSGPRRTWREPLAIFMLLFGGFVFYVGWIVGVALLLSSRVWRVKDKVLGVLIVPGGLLVPFFLIFGGTTTRVCTSSNGGPTTCTTHDPGTNWLAVTATIVFLVAEIGVAVYLYRQTTDRRAS